MADRIGIIVAMSDERKRLLGKRPQTKGRIARFPLVTLAGKREVVVIETGMGVRNASEGTEALLSLSPFRFLVSIGFGGAVRDPLPAGTVVVGKRLFRYQDGTATESSFSLLPAPFEFPGVAPATIVTTTGVENKGTLGRVLPAHLENVVVDMETWGVAGQAARNGVPLVAVRGISDTAGEEILLPLDTVTGPDGQIVLPKLLRAVLAQPRILPNLLRLGVNASRAGRNLSQFLDRLVEEA